MKPLVSILTSAYNCERHIKTYIDRLLAMTYPNVEIVFVDDGTKDKTKAILFERITEFQNKGYILHYFYQENAGQAAALNVALKNMSGEYFTILDVDDFLYAECLDKRIEVLENDSTLGFVISNGDNYNYPDTSRGDGQIFSGIDEKNFFKKVLQGFYVCNLAYTFRTSVLRKYNPEMSISTIRAGQNLQIILPYALHSQMKYLSAPLFGRVNHGDSHSQSAAREGVDNKIARENDITQIIIETLYKDHAADVWIPSVYMKAFFTKCLISISEDEKIKAVEYKRRAIQMYTAISKQFFNGMIVILKAKLKTRIRKVQNQRGIKNGKE